MLSNHALKLGISSFKSSRLCRSDNAPNVELLALTMSTMLEIVGLQRQMYQQMI